MNFALFEIFEPDADGLLSQISGCIDDAMLMEIANADYGTDVEKHFGSLRRIRDDGVSASPVTWHPVEVLELFRWSQPDDPYWRPGVAGLRGHWLRAFACTALLRAAGNVENHALREGWNQTLIQLIGSLSALGNDLDAAAAALLSWLIIRCERGEVQELGFLGLGLLWFALRLGTRIPDGVIVELCEWIAAWESRETAVNGRFFGRYAGRWLLGTTGFDQRHRAWEGLGRSLAEMELHGRSQAAREWVGLIGSALAGANRD